MIVKMNQMQNLEESSIVVSQIAENDNIKKRIGLNFSPGHCNIEADYQLFNDTNEDLIFEVTYCLTSKNSYKHMIFRK